MEFRLGKIRKERNIPRHFLASMLGVSESTLSDYENEIMHPRYEKLLKIAEALQVSIDYLTGHIDEDWMNSVVSVKILQRIHAGSYIRKIRTGNGISVEVASEQTQFSPESFSLMEAGQIPLPVACLDVIANNVGMSDDERSQLMRIVCDEENYSFLSNGLFLKTNK